MVGLALAIGGFFFLLDRQTRLPPVKMFELVFRRSAREVIFSDLQGFGHGYQGDYAFQFRFRVSPTDLQGLLDGANLTESKWEAASEKFSLRESAVAKKFSPPWAPELVASKEVYFRGNPTEKSAYIFVLVDRAEGIVYGVGFSGGT